MKASMFLTKEAKSDWSEISDIGAEYATLKSASSTSGLFELIISRNFRHSRRSEK